MRSPRAKFYIAGFVLVAAVSYLAIAGARSGWVYFLTVDQFAATQQYNASRVRLHGKVSEQDLDIRADEFTVSFKLAGDQHLIPVVYDGAIPDLFQAGREVVVEGMLDANGTFRAEVLMTKCASKYESDGMPASAARE